MPDEPVLVLLVHGTHGGASRWHQDRAREGALPASFRHTIARRLGGLAAIESFGWSGRNAVADRRAAALRLAWRCRQALRAEGHARLVLIGHSHGGNVLDMAAALLPPGLRARVHLVQVSTPFVVETPRYFRLLAADAGRTRVLGMRGDTMLQVMLVASFGFVGGVLPLLYLTFGWNALDFSTESYGKLYWHWQTHPRPWYEWRDMFWRDVFAAYQRVYSWRGILCLVTLMASAVIAMMLMEDVARAERSQRRRARARIDRHLDRLVLFHSSDEAIMALGAVSFVVNLVQHAIVRAMRLMWEGLERSRLALTLLAATWGTAGLAALLIGVWITVGRYVLLPILLLLWLLSFIPGLDLRDGARWLLVWLVDSWAGQWVAAILKYAILAVVALLPVLVAMSLLAIGAIAVLATLGLLRYALLWAIGVYGAPLGLRALSRMVFDEVTVLPTPLAGAHVHVVPGLRFFNHTGIFDEAAVVELVHGHIARIAAEGAAAAAARDGS